jgi:transcriptional regulator with GAF, ATPase, and Fis domain
MRDGVWVPRLEPKLIEVLLESAHPTNVRGLDRRLWEAMSASPSDFIVAPPAVPTEGRVTARPDDLDEATVRAALEQARGNVADAARALGLKNRQVLHRIVRKLDGT